MTTEATESHQPSPPIGVGLSEWLGAGAEAREIARVEHFDSGDTQCIRCGKTLHLYFNGGELDSVKCCGLTYMTETQRIDLVVYEKVA
jgi:hypothetical protein